MKYLERLKQRTVRFLYLMLTFPAYLQSSLGILVLYLHDPSCFAEYTLFHYSVIGGRLEVYLLTLL